MQEQEIPTINEDVEQIIPVEYDNEPIQGINATIQIGDVTTLPPGSQATVENTGTPTHAKLDFGIPQGFQGSQGIQGERGERGESATIQMNATATTLSAGSQATATITNSGDSHNANYTLTLGIPQGIQGERGVQGERGERGERGEQGIQGIQGIQGETGEAFSIYKTYSSIADMNADASNVPEGKFTLIASNVDNPDNSKLFVKNSEGTFTYLTDMSGAQGIQGERGEQGVQGIQGIQGIQGETGQRGSVKSQYVAELPASGDEDTFYLVDRDLESHTESGEYITLETTQTAAAIQSAQIDGNATQTTYSGKNLFDFDAFLTYSNATYTKSGDTYSVTNFGNLVTNRYPITVEAGKAYTLSLTKVAQGSTNVRVQVYKDGSMLGGAYCSVTLNPNYYTFTAVEGSTYELNATYTPPLSTPVIFSEPMLEQSATPTAYEPYVGGIPAPNPSYPQPISVVTGENTVKVDGSGGAQDFPIDFGAIELAKVGTYQDRIYKDGGKWYVEKQVGKVVLDGTEAWGYNGTDRVFVVSDLVDYMRTGFVPMSDYYTGQEITAYSQLQDMHIAFLTSTNSRTVVKNTNYTTANDFKTWLSTHPTTVYYALATPTTTEITNQTLIDQLEALASASLNQGVNNIWTEIATGNAMPTLELNWAEWEKYNRHNVYIWNDAINDWQIIVGMEGNETP